MSLRIYLMVKIYEILVYMQQKPNPIVQSFIYSVNNFYTIIAYLKAHLVCNDLLHK